VTGLGGSVATVTFLVWCETKTVIDVVVGAARVVGVRGVLGFGRTFGLGVVDGRDTVVGAAVVCAAVVRECPLQALTEATSTSAVIDHRPTRTTRCSHTRLRRAHRREAKPECAPLEAVHARTRVAVGAPTRTAEMNWSNPSPNRARTWEMRVVLALRTLDDRAGRTMQVHDGPTVGRRTPPMRTAVRREGSTSQQVDRMPDLARV
jgi:hypothetical protein